ncbi:hypothetical protein [Glycomyces buryatensis]|uniref:WD40 repeat domain-containing protein n=1 Tax=Glycomyces buryatensis TaxID=2570927 RepID=A0A4S8Q0S4_9ACTN|nr:hypothetical protein [Glycomyces buryatensis]THV33674.1 hypothetical protein FAB82_26435 [Glycomyces buryatensis]
MNDAPEWKRHLDSTIQSWEAAPSGEFAVFASRDALTCVDRVGNELWHFDFGPRPGTDHGIGRASCTYSKDGSVVWLYRPDIGRGRGDTDRWFALDASHGAVIGEAPLVVPCGLGGWYLPHPDGRTMFMEVGCGQDGAYLFSGTVADGGLTWAPWPEPDHPDLGDRSLLDFTPDGTGMLVIDFDGDHVMIYDYPSAAVRFTIPLEAFGFDGEEAGVESVSLFPAGRFLDDRIALVRFQGETTTDADYLVDRSLVSIGPGTDFIAYQAIDIQTGAVLGPCTPDGDRPEGQPRYLPHP